LRIVLFDAERQIQRAHFVTFRMRPLEIFEKIVQSYLVVEFFSGVNNNSKLLY